MKEKKTKISLSVVISKEENWFVASCPLLGLATQGRTEREVKDNMGDLIREYFEDPDTVKPSIEQIASASVISMPLKVGNYYGKAQITHSG